MSVPKLSAELTAIVVDVLLETRARKKLSKKKLAATAGVSRTAIRLMEAKERSPSLGLVFSLSMGIGVSFSSIVAKSERRLAKKLAEEVAKKAVPAPKVVKKAPTPRRNGKSKLKVAR